MCFGDLLYALYFTLNPLVGYYYLHFTIKEIKVQESEVIYSVYSAGCRAAGF